MLGWSSLTNKDGPVLIGLDTWTVGLVLYFVFLSTIYFSRSAVNGSLEEENY